jgi:protein phosphatase
MAREFASATDAGRVRRHNEDAVGFDALAGLAVLADGMGGHRAGEVASEMTVSTVMADLSRWRRALPAAAPALAARQAVHRSVDHANTVVLEASRTRPECRGMGTTIVLMLFNGPQVLVGQAGDSRAYRWRGGRLERLTRDHSMLEEQVDAGKVTRQHAMRQGLQHVVTRAVGVEASIDLETQVHDLQPADLMLLCSDGLTDMLADVDIAQVLAAGGPLPHLCGALVEAANAAGGADNISVVLTREPGDQFS